MTVRRLGAGLPSAVIVPSRSEFGDDCAHATRGIAKATTAQTAAIARKIDPTNRMGPFFAPPAPGTFPELYHTALS